MVVTSDLMTLKQNDKKRTTIPAPGGASHKLQKGRMIGAVIPPAPRPVIPPIVDEKPMKAASNEAEQLKKSLGYNRDPEKNNTGVSYKALITGITDAKKLNGIKNSKGKRILVFILETDYGKYVLSKKPLKELRDLHSAFIDLDCETNRGMKVPIHEITDKKEYFYFEKMEEKLDLEIEVDYSEVELGLTKTILKHTNLPEIEEVIKKAERQRNTIVNTEIEDIEVTEDSLFDIVYLAVKTDIGDEYWIFIKEDKHAKMKFSVPEMPDMIEVETEDKIYEVVTFFDREPIDISGITPIPEN